MQRDFVATRLGPLLRNNWLTKDIKIMAHDDQRNLIFDSAKKVADKNDSIKLKLRYIKIRTRILMDWAFIGIVIARMMF